jgi:hypothetical protein
MFKLVWTVAGGSGQISQQGPLSIFFEIFFFELGQFEVADYDFFGFGWI